MCAASLAHLETSKWCSKQAGGHSNLEQLFYLISCYQNETIHEQALEGQMSKVTSTVTCVAVFRTFVFIFWMLRKHFVSIIVNPVKGKFTKWSLFIISWLLIIMRKLKLTKKEVETFHTEAALTWLLSAWAVFGSDWLTLYRQAGSLQCSPSSPPGWGSGGWGWGLSDAPACHTLYTLDGRKVPFQTLCHFHISGSTGCTWSRVTGQQEVKLLPVSFLLLQPRFQHHLNVENTVLDPLQINFCSKHETVWWKTRIYIITLVRSFYDHQMAEKLQKCNDYNRKTIKKRIFTE